MDVYSLLDTLCLSVAPKLKPKKRKCWFNKKMVALTNYAGKFGLLKQLLRARQTNQQIDVNGEDVARQHDRAMIGSEMFVAMIGTLACGDRHQGGLKDPIDGARARVFLERMLEAIGPDAVEMPLILDPNMTFEQWPLLYTGEGRFVVLKLCCWEFDTSTLIPVLKSSTCLPCLRTIQKTSKKLPCRMHLLDAMSLFFSWGEEWAWFRQQICSWIASKWGCAVESVMDETQASTTLGQFQLRLGCVWGESWRQDEKLILAYWFHGLTLSRNHKIAGTFWDKGHSGNMPLHRGAIVFPSNEAYWMPPVVPWGAGILSIYTYTNTIRPL